MAAREPLSVLRLKRTDVKDSIVVVLIYSKGRNALDLELVASEGENAWGATIKESQVKQLKASSNQSSDDVWVEVVKGALMLGRPNRDITSELEGLEVVSTITKEARMRLVFRRNIGELTQRLGTIDLEPTGEDHFDLWAGCAVGAKLNAEARQQADELDAKLAEQIENNRKLHEQLKALIEAKAEHENALLQKFTELLNAKKLKIRDQQRLLATAKVDSEKVNKAQEAQSSRKARASRGSKRKAAATAPSDDKSSDGFESVQDEEDEQMKDAATPEPLEDVGDTTEGSDDDESDPPEPEPEPKKSITKTVAGRTKDSEPPKRQSASQSSRTARNASVAQARSQEQQAEKEELPPRRELLFARRKAAQEAGKKMAQDALATAPASQAKSASSAPQSSAAGDDDDTTDNEL